MFTFDDAGCYVAGQSGQYASDEAIMLAVDHGFPWPADVSQADRDTIARRSNWDSDAEPYEHVHELADEAIEWLNDNRCAKDMVFDWCDGELFLLHWPGYERR